MVVMVQDVGLSQAQTHLEEAAKVGVLGKFLGFGQGYDQESESEFVLGPGLGNAPGSDLVLGLELDPGWEFDQEWLQGFEQETGQGKFQVFRGPLGYGQVSGLHQFHLEAGCTVSGTPLKWWRGDNVKFKN